MPPRIKEGLKRLGFRSFARFVATRGTKTLTDMAVELDVSPSVFIGYHARYVDQNTKPLHLGE